jgi:hypothetical protein
MNSRLALPEPDWLNRGANPERRSRDHSRRKAHYLSAESLAQARQRESEAPAQSRLSIECT